MGAGPSGGLQDADGETGPQTMTMRTPITTGFDCQLFRIAEQRERLRGAHEGCLPEGAKLGELCEPIREMLRSLTAIVDDHGRAST